MCLRINKSRDYHSVWMWPATVPPGSPEYLGETLAPQPSHAARKAAAQARALTPTAPTPGQKH